MATKKRTSKSLQATVTKRTKPKARKARAEPCPVRTAMKGRGELIEQYHALVREWRKAAANSDREKELAEYCRAIRDRFQGAFETISHLYPNSTEGALYLLMVGYADAAVVHTITDNDVRAERRRRGLRCLYRALSYLDWQHSDPVEHHVVKEWLVPYAGSEPENLATGQYTARKLMQAAAEKAGAA